MAEVKSLSQSINFLGFLRGQLNGLHGIPTLCYELIQNADDVKDEDGNPAATKISFDVCDDALYVYNDGVFREIDFERMQKVSWGNKREEEGTTGAFGLGFISVYQVTDSPEIFSSGRHWQFVPNGPEDERIRQTTMITHETKFRLPWAFETSEVRKELGIPAVLREDLESFKEQINRSIESAALFLKQVTVLELKRNGKLIRKIETVREKDQLLLADGSQTVIWRIFEGRFEADANEMRRRYGEVIEKKRQSTVKIAVPDNPRENGLLYAFLPSETLTGLPFHINADFYPTQDRKRIIFGDGYKSEWNVSAFRCAAQIMAVHCEELLSIYSNQEFWEFSERVNKASSQDGTIPEVSQFWELLKAQIEVKNSVLTNKEITVVPSEAIFLDTRELRNAEKILSNLGLNIVHSDLRSWMNLLRETGVRLLTLSDICEIFQKNALIERKELSEMPEGLRTLEGWEVLWEAINNLWSRASSYEKQQCRALLMQISIALGDDGALHPPADLFSADQLTRDFFSSFSPVVWYQEGKSPPSFLTELIPHFSLGDGLDLLQEVQDSLPELWKSELFSPDELREWFERNRSEINYYRQKIRDLAVWPTAGGALKPFSELFLSGDFEDPLHLAKLIDLEALGGGRELLERFLGVQRLDFITYVRDWVPSVVKNGGLGREEKQALIRILAENLGRLRDHPEIQTILAGLPIVWCGGDEFNPSSVVWFDNHEVRQVMGSEIKFASLPEEKLEAIRELYLWLGVSLEPKPYSVIKRIKTIVSSAPTRDSVRQIGDLIDYMARKWTEWEESEKGQFAQLKSLAWLPGTKDRTKWYDSKNIYSEFQKHLFESQGNFLYIDLRIQQKASGLFKYLEIESDPPPDLVVGHLLNQSAQNIAPNRTIYDFLVNYATDPSINNLKDNKCLYFKEYGVDKYFSPDQVFWEQHPFGKYRFQLPAEKGNWKPLFDRLGVKAKPEVDDAIKVILEISQEFGTSNVSLEDAPVDEGIIYACWKMITHELEEGNTSADKIKQQLGKQKTIPNVRKILIKPELMFFEDRPGWGEKFTTVKNNLVNRIEGAWLGMEAAGVRPLSSVIETEIITCENRTENKELDEHIHARRNLILRVIEHHRTSEKKVLNISVIENLPIYKADHIEIVRIFNEFDRRENSTPETVDAILLDGSLYYCTPDNTWPWTELACELAYVLNPTGELLSLGMELNGILSQSPSEAKKLLDKLGYPLIEIIETPIAEGERLQPASEDEDLEGLRRIIDFPEAGKQDSTPLGGQAKERHADRPAGSTSAPQGAGSADHSPEKRKSSRLRSYVYPEGVQAAQQEDPSIAIRKAALAKKGVERVMQFERDQGREPKDMEEIQVHHPGYDIESMDMDGTKRFIEVKSLSGIWDGQSPAVLTKMEFETAKKKGDSFWLYIVEHANSQEFQIHRIMNPANRVDTYHFDHGWLDISEK